MKRIAAIVGLTVLAAFAAFVPPQGRAAEPATGTPGAPEPPRGSGASSTALLRWHWTGRAALAHATNATTLKQVDALPITDELRVQVSSNLARAAVKFWQKDLPTGAPDATTLLQPLLYDFLTAEAFTEVRGPVGRAETVLALELNETRAALWSTNLWQLAALWKLGAPNAITAEGFTGWEARKATAPSLLQFFRAGKWVVLGLGQDPLTLAPALLRQTKQRQRPVAALDGSLADLQADLPGLKPWIPILTQFPLAPARLTMAGRGENVRTEVRFQFPGKVPWTYEPWKIPTNLVSEPLGSFTVGRGVAAWLGRIKGLKELGLNPLPNQFCAWGITNDICRFYFTVPVADATNVLKHLAPTAPMLIYNRYDKVFGDFIYLSNRAELNWAGIPYIQPFLKAARGTASDFVLGGLFFLLPRNYQAPSELYGQLGTRTNLLYYDWELTDHRIEHGKQFYDLTSIATARRPPLPTGSLSRKWTAAAGPLLKDSVTEITQTGPQELTLIRKSSIGFTGIELATLSAWVDSPGFPFRIDPAPPLPGARTNAAARAKPAPGNP